MGLIDVVANGTTKNGYHSLSVIISYENITYVSYVILQLSLI